MIDNSKISAIVNSKIPPEIIAPLLEKYSINTINRISHFFSQVMHESIGLTATEENLNYSAAALLETFPKYFKDKATASAYARQPQKIANRVYANRMGNGNETSGDGWKYKGRGYLQITGKDNYTALSKGLNFDFVNNPDQLKQHNYALESAMWWWNNHNLNNLADQTNAADNKVKQITKVVNGGYIGLDDRLNRFNKIMKILTTNP
jgi:putative chitinase